MLVSLQYRVIEFFIHSQIVRMARLAALGPPFAVWDLDIGDLGRDVALVEVEVVDRKCHLRL